MNPGTAGRLTGTIDEFAVYNSVLTPAQVTDHFKAGTGTGQAPGPPRRASRSVDVDDELGLATPSRAAAILMVEPQGVPPATGSAHRERTLRGTRVASGLSRRVCG